MSANGQNMPLVIRSELPPLARLGWLVHGCQLELRFGSSRQGAEAALVEMTGTERALNGTDTEKQSRNHASGHRRRLDWHWHARWTVAGSARGQL